MEMTEGLYLRPVEGTDADLLLQWRNDQTVRVNSFHMDEISREVHEKWLKDVLADRSQYFFILMKADIPIGQVRVQKEGTIGLVNYSISEPYRAQGFGKKIMVLLENYLVMSNISVSLKAYVKHTNVASQKIFEDLGYSLTNQSEVVVYQKDLLKYISFENVQKFGGDTFLNQ